VDVHHAIPKPYPKEFREDVIGLLGVVNRAFT